jgi:hypothetical protein
MGNSVKSLKKLIDECSDTNRGEWTDEARTILEAVRRTSRPTKWKVKHTIAEAILKKIVVPSIVDSCWKLRAAKTDNPSCDVLLERDFSMARIEILLLRPATAKFRRIYRGQHSESAYALEMQKPQKQTKAVKTVATGKTREIAETDSAIGRSYSFGEFDILAVNTHAVTHRWTDFRYTLSAWLRPLPSHRSLIDKIQLVSLRPNDVWTDDLGVCLDRFSRTDQGTISST